MKKNRHLPEGAGLVFALLKGNSFLKSGNMTEIVWNLRDNIAKL